MLSIAERSAGQSGSRRLLLEGRVTGAWVEELRRACDEVARAGADRLELDLAGVLFLDRQGLALFAELSARGCRFLNASAFVVEQLKEVPNAVR
jgi:ABC-type transporter Mla MlaB component